MSMLAERRQKQKWSLNPRGKWWTEDSNKFGQRMLEKMGWTKGKGLGANEQGITEFSSVSHKNDTTGVGYDKNVDVWTEHQEKFGDLLQQLNGNQDQDAGKKAVNEDANLNGQSVELKSKRSHARIHYKKFTHGKDITKYKSKDLANIFGQKELAEKKSQSKTKKDDIPETEVGIRDNWYGVVTINGGNMADYFKLKSNYNNTDRSKDNVNNDANSSSSMTENRMTDSESESDQHVGFGFISKTESTLSVANYGALNDSDGRSNYAFDNPCLGLNSPTETAGSTNRGSPAKSMKKRKKEFESDNLHVTEIDKHNARKKLKTEAIDGDCRNGFINPALNLDARPEEDCNGKEFEVVRAQFGLENCGLDLTDERNGKKRVTFNDHVMLYEYNVNSTKKRKGEITLDKFEVENKKSKKKRKHESTATPVTNGFVNEALDVQILFEEINDNELNEHRNKKVKKRKISNLETIQESPEKEIIEISIESEDTLDTNSAENGETDTVELKLKKKQKKKEKKEKRAKDDDITVLDAINEELEPDIEIVKVISNKKMKKTKDRKEEEKTAISKKCKKKKKKDKENCKSENHMIQTEISNAQQDIEILDKSDSKRQQNDLIESKNKDAAIIETLLDPTTKEKSLEKTKQKKKRKSLDKEDSSEINVCNTEREISDKENTDKEQDLNAIKLTKKDKKSKKSKHKNVSDVEDSSNPNKEVADVNVIKQDEIENAECTEIPSKKGKMIDAIDNIISSPWNVKARMSKKMLITLFHNNAILEFPGSNIHNIKGYGTDDVECEL